MGRKNRRDHRWTAPPLDSTPAKDAMVIPVLGHTVEESRTHRQVLAAERQMNARAKNAIDWSVCLVPGCGEELKWFSRRRFDDVKARDPEKVLPLCLRHEVLVWQRVQLVKGETAVIETNQELLEREAEAEAARKRRRMENLNGHIYFVRLNGLVKVGWSRSVHDRLRAYGPLADVLCIYPGSRMDETTLHRQLRPVLARGREWYEDCKIIADFAAKAVEQHGPPVTYDEWTKPKTTPIRPRRSA